MYGTGKQGIKGREDNTKMSETYEIIVLDLDGTLTNSKKVITPKTKEALMRIQKEGKKVVLASGRPTGGIVKLADELDLKSYGGFVLAFNGGKIINYGTGEIVYNKTIPVELVPAVYEQACRLGVGVLTYKGNTIIHGNGVNEYSRNEGKINGMPMKEVDNFAEYVDYPVNKFLMTGEPEKIAKARFRIHLAKTTALLRFQISFKTRKRLNPQALKRAKRLFIHIDFKFKLGKRVISALMKIGV